MATKDHGDGGQDAGGAWLRELSVSVRLRDGTVAERSLRLVLAGQVVSAAPWRMTRSARGQTHYPGYYWSATTGGHVIYESRLELARLLLADFDPGVTAIAAQPFLLRTQAGGRVRRHVPDFLLVRADQAVVVVNVKPAARLAEPAVAEALAWPGDLFEARGWGYEIWSGADPVVLANVRFLIMLAIAVTGAADYHTAQDLLRLEPFHSSRLATFTARLRQHGILEPVTAAICQLARKLDEHGTPVDRKSTRLNSSHSQ